MIRLPSRPERGPGRIETGPSQWFCLPRPFTIVHLRAGSPGLGFIEVYDQLAFYVYMLQCNDGSYYVGHTDDYDNRLTQHLEGQNRHTSKRLPVNLIWVTDFPTRNQAKEFEYKLKRWNRKKKAALAAGDIEALKLAARKVNWIDYRIRDKNRESNSIDDQE